MAHTATHSETGPTPARRQIALTALSGFALCHLLNDAIQALLPAVYPIIKPALGLSFTEIGMIGLVFQITASIFQPAIGSLFDAFPRRWPLPAAMVALSFGLTALAFATSYPVILLAAFLIGIGSAIFHPEASRGTRLAARGRYGFAQSVFQTGGSIGMACGPLLAAFVIVPFGQRAAFYCVAISLLGFIIVLRLSGWLFAEQSAQRRTLVRKEPSTELASGRRTLVIIGLLTFLIITKNLYTSAMQNYYSFLLIERFGLSVQAAQIWLFVFLASVAVGTLGGGLLTDRIGTRRVINLSILGTLPFSLALTHAGLAGTIVLSIGVGLVLSSAFSAIVVYGQELMPHRVGLISGLFFGLAFGFSGIGAALLGMMADNIGLEATMTICGVLPAAGLLSFLLPDLSRGASHHA